MQVAYAFQSDRLSADFDSLSINVTALYFLWRSNAHRVRIWMLSPPPPARAFMRVAEAFKSERDSDSAGLVNVTRGCVIEIGRELIAAKADVGHGNWLGWLHREFGWSVETARKFMQVAEAFKFQPGWNLESLSIDASAFFLSAPSVPQEIRSEAVELAEAGKRVTLADAERLVAEKVAAAVREMDDDAAYMALVTSSA